MVNYENYSLGEQRQHNQSVMASVIASKEDLRRANAMSGQLETSALVGRQGIISQLRQIVDDNPDEPALLTKVYLMTVKTSIVEGKERTGLEIVYNQVFFSAVGDFEENLVTYGIK